MSESESEYISKGPCDGPKGCGSSDANALYSDGHTHCFACGKTKGGTPLGEDADGTTVTTKPIPRDFLEGVFRDLPTRKLTKQTCEKTGYRIGKLSDGEFVRIIPVTKKGQLVGQKIKPSDKDDTFAIGNHKKCDMFMQSLFKGGGKQLIITEGEEDAMSVYQQMGYKWPVVSVTKGAKSAVDDIKYNIEFVEGYEKVIFMFDMDPQGRAAVDECASILTPGKAFNATLPVKDANECLIKGQGAAIVSAVFEAKEWRPDGVFTLDEIFDEAIQPVKEGLPWCVPEMTKWTFGRRPGELIGFGAGTGVGKTDFLTQQIVFDVIELEQNVGIIFLEQHRSETANRLAGKLAGKPFHVPDGSWSDEERVSTIRRLADTGRLNIYSSFGVADWDRIKVVLRAMVVQQGCKLIYLDHLTALADPAKERESLEIIMAELASMCQELGCIIHYVSHLSTPEGKSHEEGGQVSLRHFKGARAIGYWTFFAFGIERNKNAEDPDERCIATIRCVKDRFTGRGDGCTVRVKMNLKTTRLEPYLGFSVESFDDDPGYATDVQNLP
ncbi:DnaB-like helicase C-terminal domain-containing protein